MTPLLQEKDLPLLGFGPLETMVRSATFGMYDFETTMTSIETARATTSGTEDDVRRDKFHAIGALLEWAHLLEGYMRMWRVCLKTPTSMMPDQNLPNKILSKMHACISDNYLLSLGPTSPTRTAILDNVFKALVEVLRATARNNRDKETIQLSSLLVTTLGYMATNVEKLENLKSLLTEEPSPFTAAEFTAAEQIEVVQQMWEDVARLLAQSVHTLPEPAAMLARIIKSAPPTFEVRKHLFAAAKQLITGETP